MIVANVAFGAIGQETDLGDHQFAVLPRVGESFLTYIDGNVTPVTVAGVFHYPRSPNGPDREPTTVLRVVPGEGS